MHLSIGKTQSLEISFQFICISFSMHKYGRNYLKLTDSEVFKYSHNLHFTFFTAILAFFSNLFFSAILALIFSNLFSAHPLIFPISSLHFLQSSRSPYSQISSLFFLPLQPHHCSLVSVGVVFFASRQHREMAMQLRNPSHPKHELELKKYLKPYTCDGCMEIGFGPRYRCEKCDFDLHKACMFPQDSPVSHEFFPGSTFKFFRAPPRACHDKCKRNCDACRKPINRFMYHCNTDDLDLHPCCRNLSRNYQIEDVGFNLHKEVQGKCMWCKKKSIKGGGHDNGWSYISECGEYHVHVACVTEMALEEWYKSGGDWINADNANQDQQLALQKVNLKALQARGRGDGGKGNKFWRILKVFIKTIVSIVLGDPTTVLASLFVELIG